MPRTIPSAKVGSPAHPRYTIAIEQLDLGPRLDARDVLTGVFGFDDFRPGQEKIISTVLGGRDCIGVMPTGAGKSLTFQIPSRILPGTTLVVSPLISLMKDQVDALVDSGVPAACVNSTLSAEERRRVARPSGGRNAACNGSAAREEARGAERAAAAAPGAGRAGVAPRRDGMGRRSW